MAPVWEDPFQWNSLGQETGESHHPPPLSSAANKVMHSHFKTNEKPDLIGQPKKPKGVLLGCLKPWEGGVLSTTKLRCK